MKLITPKPTIVAFLLLIAGNTMAASTSSSSVHETLQNPADAEISILHGANDAQIDPLWLSGNGTEAYLPDTSGHPVLIHPEQQTRNSAS